MIERHGYTIMQMAETRWFYYFNGKNDNGDTLIVEVSKCEPDNAKNKKTLPNLWFNRGVIDRILDSYWCINTYATNRIGDCYGRYNPTIVRSGEKINFDWMLEATEENLEKILDEVIRLANEEPAHDDYTSEVDRYLKTHTHTKTYMEIPEGWSLLKGALTAPKGSDWIYNKKSILDKKYESALLVY